jgi:hypothetical protein
VPVDASSPLLAAFSSNEVARVLPLYWTALVRVSTGRTYSADESGPRVTLWCRVRLHRGGLLLLAGQGRGYRRFPLGLRSREAGVRDMCATADFAADDVRRHRDLVPEEVEPAVHREEGVAVGRARGDVVVVALEDTEPGDQARMLFPAPRPRMSGGANPGGHHGRPVVRVLPHEPEHPATKDSIYGSAVVVLQNERDTGDAG